MTAERKLAKASMALLLQSPFYAALVMRLEMNEVKSVGEKKRTIDTNGKVINWGREFIDSVEPDQLQGALGQMGLHMGFGHHVRRQTRDKTLWNIASDVITNHILKDSNMKLPKDALFAEDVGKAFGLKQGVIEELPNMTTERAYDVLQNSPLGDAIQQANKNGQKPPPGAMGRGPLWGEVEDLTGDNGEDMTKEEMDAEAQDAEEAMSAAAQSAKQQGKLPGALEKLIGASKKQRVDWARVMFEHVQGTRPQDYSFRRPNRRYAEADVVLPAIEKFGVGEVIVFVDTSGSISPAELKAYLGEANNVLDMIQPEKLVVVPVDAQIHHKGIVEYAPGDDLTTWKAMGGGGTVFDSCWPWVKKTYPEAKKVLFLSDGYASFGQDPHLDLLWIITSDAVPPFGQHIKMDLSK